MTKRRNIIQDWFCMILSWFHHIVLISLKALCNGWQELGPRPDVHRVDYFKYFELGTCYKDASGQVFRYRKKVKR